jgi:hypothetical protein
VQPLCPLFGQLARRAARRAASVPDMQTACYAFSGLADVQQACQTCSHHARRAASVPWCAKALQACRLRKQMCYSWQTCNSLTRCSGRFPDMQLRGMHATAWRTCKQQGRFTLHGRRADSPPDLQKCSQNVRRSAGVADVQQNGRGTAKSQTFSHHRRKRAGSVACTL